MNIKEIALRNFMCYKYVNLNIRNLCTFVCGPNGSGKTALLKAIEFMTTKRYESIKEAEHLIRHSSDGIAFVKILFDFIDETNEIENITAIRYFTRVDSIYVEHDGRSVYITIDKFHLKFKLNSMARPNFFHIDVNWKNMDNMNLLSFIKFKTNGLGEEEEFIENVKASRKKEYYPFVEKLYIEEEILEMLWYSKHFDHKRLVQSEILMKKLQVPPQELEAKVKFEAEYNALSMEIGEKLMNERILAVEEKLHLEITQLQLIYDDYRNVIAIVTFFRELMIKTDEFFSNFMSSYKNAKSAIQQLIAQSSSTILQENYEFYLQLDEKLENLPVIKIKTYLDQLIVETEIKRNKCKKNYDVQRQLLSKLHRKFCRKQTKKDKFLQFLEIFRKDFAENLNEKYKDIPEKLFQARSKTIPYEQLWLNREVLHRLKHELEWNFSMDTIRAVDNIRNLQLIYGIGIIEIVLRIPRKDDSEFWIRFDLDFDDILPVIEFHTKEDFIDTRIKLTNDNCVVELRLFDGYMNEVDNIIGIDFILEDITILSTLLEEWLIICNKQYINDKAFVQNETPTNVIYGGFKNTTRYKLYKQVIATQKDIDEHESHAQYYACLAKKYKWIPSLWDDTYKNYCETILERRFKDNNVLCKNICQVADTILEKQKNNFNTFKEYHRLNAKLKLLKTIYMKQIKLYDKVASLQEYEVIESKFYSEKSNAISYGRLLLNSLYDHHFTSYLWHLNKAVIELQLNLYYKIITNFEDSLLSFLEEQSKVISKIIEINGNLREVRSLQESYMETVLKQEDFLRKKFFPIDYDPENLDWSNYEESVYEKYKNLDFFEIHYKLKSARDFIEYYKYKYKLKNIPDRKLIALILKNCDQLLSIKRNIDRLNQNSFFDVFLKLTKEVDRIFRILSEHDVSVHFFIEHDENLTDIANSNINFDTIPNVITMINDGRQQFIWISMDKIFKFLLVLSVYLTLALQFGQKIICIEGCEVPGVFLDNIIDYAYGQTIDQVIPRNYLQNVVNFCKENGITLFMECRETILVNDCNLVQCESGDSFSSCVVIDGSLNEPPS